MAQKRKRRYSKSRKKKAIRRNLLILLFILVIIAMAVIIWRMAVTHEENVLQKESQMIAYDSGLEKNPYNQEGISFNGDYASYNDGTYTSLQGIDVSSHNGTIDWAEVKNQGIDFAMLRAGYRGYDQGQINKDIQFEANYEGVKENNMQVGVYFFSQAVNVDEAAEEADFVIECLRGKDIDLPIVFDMEIPDASSRVAGLSRQDKTRAAVTFMNRIEDAGYKAMIYASSQQMNSIFDLQYLQNYSFWIAEYETKWPDYAYMYSMWQYSSTGEIDGIDENVDMDLLLVKRP